MRQLFFYTFLFLGISITALAGPRNSPFKIGIALGAANFLGDAGGGADESRDDIRDIKFQQTRFSGGIYGNYRFNKTFALGLNLYYARLAGVDVLSENPARHYRNTSFKNDIIELSGQAEISLFSTIKDGHRYRLYGVKGGKRFNFRLYGLIGIGGFYHNPKSLINGKWIALKQIGTEGQHLSDSQRQTVLNEYSNKNIVINKPYNNFVVNFPIGMGMTYQVNSIFTIGYELSARYTLSDYIDDISNGPYLDPSFFNTVEGQYLANLPKTAEADAFNNSGNNYRYPTGTPRGSAKRNDFYLYSLIKLNYTLQKSPGRKVRPKYEKFIRLVKPKELKAKPKNTN